MDGDELEGEGATEGENMTELEMLEKEIGLGYLELVDYSVNQDQESFETKIKKAESWDLT